jgi:hypothetical protein
MTLPIPYNNFPNSYSAVTIPPTETHAECEDQNQGPTREPRVWQETRTSDEGRETRTKYWLRHRPTGTLTAPDDTTSEVIEEQTDNAATGIDPLTSPIVEVGQEPTPRKEVE